MSTLSIQQALPLLEQGAILQTIQHPITKIWLRENYIHLLNDHLHAVISIQDFHYNYETYSFLIIQDDGESLDLKKDEEFYTWKQ